MSEDTDRVERYEIAAKLLEQWMKEDCECESGGGVTDLEPGFVCGSHLALNDLMEEIFQLKAEREKMQAVINEAKEESRSYMIGANLIKAITELDQWRKENGLQPK